MQLTKAIKEQDDEIEDLDYTISSQKLLVQDDDDGPSPASAATVASASAATPIAATSSQKLPVPRDLPKFREGKDSIRQRGSS